VGKTSLDEKWRYCARCGIRHAESNLLKDPKTGNEYCLAQVVCYDDVDEIDEPQYQKGEVFGR
jgi:hypothetical protein